MSQVKIPQTFLGGRQLLSSDFSEGEIFNYTSGDVVNVSLLIITVLLHFWKKQKDRKWCGNLQANNQRHSGFI